MAIDVEVQDGNNTICFGADDTGVTVYELEGEGDGLRVDTKEAAVQIAKWFLRWAGVNTEAEVSRAHTLGFWAGIFTGAGMTIIAAELWDILFMAIK